MTKVQRNFEECNTTTTGTTAEESLIGKVHVSRSPKKTNKKIYLWNASPLPPVILLLMIVLCFTFMIHGASGAMDSVKLQDEAPNTFSNAHQIVQGSPLLASSSLSPLSLSSSINRNLAVNNEEKIIDLYECSDADHHHPKDLELFMENLSKIKSEQVMDDHNDLNETYSKPGKRRNVTHHANYWEPNIKLFENKEIGLRTEFRLHQKLLSCPEKKVKKIFHWHPKWSETLKLEESWIKTSPKAELSDLSLLENGDLVWNKEQGARHIYRKEEYCISRQKERDWVSFMVCTSDCLASPCFRKCCPPSHVINRETRACVPADPSWRPYFYKGANEQEKNIESLATHASIIVGFPNCPKYEINMKSPTNNFKLLLNGSLIQIDGVKHHHISMGEFCIDGVYNGKDSEGLPVQYSRSEWDQIVIACVPRNKDRWEMDKWRIPLYASLNCVSAVFLLLTDIVYLLLWRHQNIHGWLQFSYATSLFCTFNCFVIVQWWSWELISISTSLCKIMGYMSHLTYLSAFFWLTSMNFDLWWRFSRPLRNSRMRPQVKKLKRFLGFAAFSIGIPVLICSIGITLDTIYDKDPPFTVPGFGKEKCYFENKRSQVPYMYGPAGVLLLVDLIFFTSTVLHLRKIHAHTELARTQSTMEDKKGLRVFAKLFVVMGVLWVFELVPWIAHIVLEDKEMILIWIFIPIDVLNCLQGVAIFCIFVCKPNVFNQLMALFRKDDAAMTWNKQTQLPSVATVQQTIKPNDYTCTDMK